MCIAPPAIPQSSCQQQSLPTNNKAFPGHKHNFEEIWASPGLASGCVPAAFRSDSCSKVLFSLCWWGLRAGFHLSRLIYMVSRAKLCFTISCKSSKALIFTPTVWLLLCMPKEGGTAQNRSVRPRAIPPVLVGLLLPTATSPGTPGFAVSLFPAQILLKTLPFHFSERCSANLFLPT